MTKAQKRRLIVTAPPLPRAEDFGAVNVTQEGYKITQTCTDCGTVLRQFAAPPDMHINFRDKIVTCCKKLRWIG